MTLVRQLTQLINRKPITVADLKHAQLLVLDTVACAIAGLDTEPARILAQVPHNTSGDPMRRAFYFGGLSHIIEMDDLHRSSVTHPGAVVIPAAWAVAEAENIGGQAFLKAVLKGYEACCRVGNAVGKAHYKIWHNTSTCGPFGSATAAASLYNLSEDRTAWALGNAGTQSSGLWEFMASGAMSKHLHTARAAESGLLAAYLARTGFTGPDSILEGDKGFFKAFCSDPEPERVLVNPDEPWELNSSSIKPWPCCRHTHPAIDAALALHSQIGSKAITQVDIHTYRAALNVCDRPTPNDAYSAKFSLQHCVAIALQVGEVKLNSFDENACMKTHILRPKINLHFSDEIETGYPEAWGSEVQVTLVDGQKLESKRKHAKGDPQNALSEKEMVQKALNLMVFGGIKKHSAEALVKKISELVDDRPVRDLKLFKGASLPRMR